MNLFESMVEFFTDKSPNYNVEIPEDFKAVLGFLNTIPYINNGGCAISALAMYRWLKANNKLGNNTSFYFLEDDEDQHMQNKRCLAIKHGKPTSCDHAVLNYNGIHIDSRGKYNIHEPYKLEIRDENFIVKAINNIRTWNYFFQREEQIPVIEMQLGIDLSDIVLE